MSLSVDQRMKGQANQVSNGPKDNVNDEDFDAWRHQPHQSYTSPPMSSSSMADPYMSSYYHSVSFPYLNQGIGEGAWSNGDPVTFLGGYGDQQYVSDGIFGQTGFSYSQPGFSYFPGSGDYSTWGSSGRKTNHSYHEDYYREVGRMDYDVKSVEQGVNSLNLGDKSESAISKDGKLITPTDLKSSPSGDSSSSNSAPKKMSWASVASQPAKPQPKLKSKAMPPAPLLQAKQNMDIGTWDNKNNLVSKPGAIQPNRPTWGGVSRGRGTNAYSPPQSSVPSCGQSLNYSTHPVLEKLRSTNEYNPKDFNLNPKGARFFIIKSYSEDDIHRSIKYSIWCSTEHGNKRLDGAFKEREGKGVLFLFFSVNGSGHFCGMAQMMSEVDYSASSGVWAQDKWKGQFKVKWIYVKDVPNRELRHIRLENNENKPVTNSRDTQEVPCEKGKQVLKIMHSYRHTTSIFDDFIHYEKRQEEDDQRKVGGPQEEKRRINDC